MKSTKIVMENRTKTVFLQAETLTPSMYEDFVRYIDRSEKTTRTYLKNLKAFAAWTAYSGITQPTRENVIAYRTWLSSKHDAIKYDTETGWKYRVDKHGNHISEKLKSSTVSAYLRSVKQFFAWTEASGIYPDIAKGVRVPKVSKEHKKDALPFEAVPEIESQILSDGEKKKKGAAASLKDRKGKIQRAAEQELRMQAMYLLAINAGLRTIEISRADVKDFVQHGKQAWLYVYGKGRSEADQKKAIAPEVASALRDYLEARKDGAPMDSPLFVATGNRSAGKRIAATTISTMLKQVMVSAGYSDQRLTAHSLRHTTATAVMQMSGRNLYQTEHYMRHASPTTTELYLHIDQEKEDAETAEKLFEYYQL